MTTETTREAICTAKKATIYRAGGFMGNIGKTLVRDLEAYWAPYAQYPRCVHIEYVEAGKRTRRRSVVNGYKPFILILDGHGHIEPDSFLGAATKATSGLMCSQSRYSSHDAGWQRDFNAQVDKYIAEAKPTILLDIRDREEAN